MVYKFIRTDVSEPYKVVLPVGKHVIGRGKFLMDSVEDNKVSRNHAELIVTASSVTVRSLHINPCFFIKRNTEDTQVLLQNDTIILNNGDKFGILPQIYWFEVICCPEENIQENENIKHPEITDGQLKTDTRMTNSNEQVETCMQMSNTVQNETCVNMNIIKEENVSNNFDADETDDNRESEESISLTKNQTSIPLNNIDSPEPEVITDQSRNLSTPVKRPHDAEEAEQNEELKRAKTESENNDTSIAGPSNEEKISPKKEIIDEPSQSSAQPTVQLRERCMYGANCYRKNIQHKTQFSHPRDTDWNDNRRQCQFGANCRRRDPRHWRDYLHPPGVNPPSPNHAGMQVVERNGNIFHINAHTVNFYEDRFQVEDSDGDSVDYDYEF